MLPPIILSLLPQKTIALKMPQPHTYLDDSNFDDLVAKIQEFKVPGTEIISSALSIQAKLLTDSAAQLTMYYKMSIYYIFLKMRHHAHAMLSLLSCDNYTCANILLRTLFDHCATLFFIATRDPIDKRNDHAYELLAKSKRQIFRNLHHYDQLQTRNKSEEIADLSSFGIIHDPSGQLKLQELKRIEMKNKLLSAGLRQEMNSCAKLDVFFADKSDYWKEVRKIKPDVGNIWEICKENDKFMESSNELSGLFSGNYFRQMYKTLFMMCCHDTHPTLGGLEHILFTEARTKKLSLMILAEIKALPEILFLASYIYDCDFSLGESMEIARLVKRNREWNPQ